MIFSLVWILYFTSGNGHRYSLDGWLFRICGWSERGWFRWFNDVILGHSVMVEFRTVCQHCQILIIDYVSRDVGRETLKAHFNQVFFTLFILSKYVCNGELAIEI